MTRGTLTRVSSTQHSGNNRGVCVGGFVYEPAVGACFQMMGPSISPDASMRMITTSTVVEVTRAADTITFKTETGSVYTLDILRNDIQPQTKPDAAS